LGSYDNGDDTFTVLINEIPNTAGVVRAHGGRGAFVSKWTVDKETLKVGHGEDLIKRLYRWDRTNSQWEHVPSGSPLLNMSRLCSADLPVDAFYDATTGLGSRQRIFMNGEEAGREGRGLGTVVTGPDAGSSYDLPWLGRLSWENSVGKPDAGARTLVAGLHDAGGGQVYFYVGSKKDTGTDVEGPD
jgi:hypothetical protein